jgi:OOP family OmpA-OmpF porin
VLPAAFLVAFLSSNSGQAVECVTPAGLSPCFDANALWLPAGSSHFMALPDTPTTAIRQPRFGFSSELLHRPVRLHALSPDAPGRDVQVVDFAFDSSLFVAVGVLQNVDVSLALPVRVYEQGAGLGGVASQAAPEITRSALRDPRFGFGYSLDHTLNTRGLGLRLGLDVTFPLGNEQVFSGERSFVMVPQATFGFQRGRLRSTLGVGLRLRRAVDFGGVHLGNQGFIALGIGAEVLDPGLLFVSIEAFGLPPLVDNRAASAGPLVTEVRLFPAEWLASVHSSLGTGNWSLGLGAGTGIPLSSETRATANGPNTQHFLGLTTPEFRSALVLSYTVNAPH